MILLFLVVITSADIDNDLSAKVSEEVIVDIVANHDVSVVIKLKHPVENAGDNKDTQELIKELQEEVLESLDKEGVVVGDENNDEYNADSDEEIDKAIVLINEDSPELVIDHQFENSPVITATANKEAIEELINNPNVESITSDLEVKVFLDDSIPIIHADYAWQRIVNNRNITGVGQTVCVIDSGIYYNHTNLGGYFGVMVVAGKNTITNTNCTITNDECHDDHYHGTHVAGIVASNHSTYKGVAPDAKLVAIKALNSAGTGSMNDVVEGIDWCVSNKDVYNISVVSMSLGTSVLYTTDACPDNYNSQLESAREANVTLVAASGNSGSTTQMSYPACHPIVISVGMSDNNDALNTDSNRNSDLDILAPGVSITSMDNDHITDTISRSGTSMAAPHVSAAIALLRQDQFERDGKNLTVSEIESLITETNVTISDYPRLDVYWTIVPNIVFVSPILDNNSYTVFDYVFVNITTRRVVTSSLIEINGTNYTMNSNADNNNFYLNITGLTGLHNYTVYINDSSSSLFKSDKRFCKINNTVPEITSQTPSSLQLNIYETDEIIFNHTSRDNNSDSLNYYWYLSGDIQSDATDEENFTFIPNTTQAGVYNVSLIVTDSYENATVSWNMTVNNFAAPNLTQIENISVDVDETTNATIDITVVAVDDPGDTLYYSINMSNFTQYDNLFSWNVTYFDTGNYYVNVSVNDSNLSSSQIVLIIIGDLTDSDNDGSYDVLDSDDDNDGLDDTSDNLKGDLSSISVFESSDGASSSSSLSGSTTIAINGSTNLVQQFNGEFNLTLKIGSNITIETLTNFSEININLYNITISKQNSSYPRGFLIVTGLQISGTKTIYIDDINTSYNTLCVKDADVDNLSGISLGCNGANERLVTCDGLDSVYNCSRVDNNTRYVIQGLSHSAVHEQCADNDDDGYGTGCPLGSDCNDNNAGIHAGCSTSTSSGGGGGGGGGSSSSGGGGGGSSVYEDATETFAYSELKKSEKKEIKLDNEVLPITKLGFKVINKSKSVTLTIKSYKKQPKRVKSSAPGYVYKYMSVQADNLAGTNVKDIDVAFRLNQSYVIENDLNMSTTKLYYYNSKDNNWILYPATWKSSTSGYYNYETELSAFDYMAVSLNKNFVPQVDAGSKTQFGDGPGIEGEVVKKLEEKPRKWLFNESSFSILIILIVSLIVLIVIGFFIKRRIEYL